MTRFKRVPLRMCVGCREKRSKRELTRIVRTPAGEVQIDPTGKKSGRGAYICSNPVCLDKVIKNKVLEKALEVRIDEAIVEQLRKQFAEMFPTGD